MSSGTTRTPCTVLRVISCPLGLRISHWSSQITPVKSVNCSRSEISDPVHGRAITTSRARKANTNKSCCLFINVLVHLYYGSGKKEFRVADSYTGNPSRTRISLRAKIRDRRFDQHAREL